MHKTILKRDFKVSSQSNCKKKKTHCEIRHVCLSVCLSLRVTTQHLDYRRNDLRDSDNENPTPFSTVHPEKLTVFQLVKKSPAFYGTQRLIAALS